jgi:multiple antibiotic resistance protein
MLDFATTAFVSVLFLVDPPGTVPAFISLTSRFTPEKRRKTALVASVTATLTLMAFAAVGVAPLAVPMLAGPAALSTVTVLMAQASGPSHIGIVFAAIGLTGCVCYVVLRLAEPIQKRIGKTGIHILDRVLGLVLAGIAVQFVLNGLKAAELIPVK